MAEDQNPNSNAAQPGEVLEPEGLAPSQRGPVAYPRLEVIEGPREGLILGLEPGEQTLGRSKTHAQLVLDDTSVSRLHTRFTREGDRLTVADLGSKNGTYLNNRRLKKEEETPLSHLNLVRIGIYTLCVAFRPYTAAELAAVRQNPAPKPKAPPAPPPPVSPLIEEKNEEKPAEAPPAATPFEVDAPQEPPRALTLPSVPANTDPVAKKIRTVFWIVCGISILLGVFFLFWKQNEIETVTPITPITTQPTAPETPQTQPTVPAPPEVQAPAEGVPQPAAETPTFQAQTPQVPSSASTKALPFLLDVRSEPLPARIFFQDKFLGTTPLRSSIEVVPGQDYELVAEFELKDLKDRYQQKTTFKADARSEVIPLQFKAELGVITVRRLPRDAQFYLEGYYAYDKFKANPVRLQRVQYGQPIFVPYGNYVVELREKARVGTSQSFVNEIRYHREFEISTVRPQIELDVQDRDLQTFPAKIQSTPSGASVFWNGVEVGKTPFNGELPLGRYDLKLTKEGFFDHVETLDVRVNSLFETQIAMKTSRAGEHIYRALELRAREDFTQALAELVEALKAEPSPKEKAWANLLIAALHQRRQEWNLASVYFEQAKVYPDFYLRAVLGLAQVQFSQKNSAASLPLLVEVLLNAGEDKGLYNEGMALLKQVSPLKSVIYLSTEPAGATVRLNNQSVGQGTPVILSDLAFGNYRFEITKAGFKPQQIKKNLKLSEFVPIFVKLEPEGL